MSDKQREITEDDRRYWRLKGLMLAFKEVVDTIAIEPGHLMSKYATETQLQFRLMMEEVWKEVFSEIPK